MRASTSLILATTLAFASPALAARQALEVRATVTAVDPAAALAAAVGDAITVTVTLDTGVSDDDPSPTFGHYTFGSVTFDFDIQAPSQGWGQMTAGDTVWEIIDRPVGQPDELRISAGMLSGLPGPLGAQDAFATLVFTDPTGTAVTSDALILPTVAAFLVGSLEIVADSGAWQIDAEVDATRVIPFLDLPYVLGQFWIDGYGFTPNGTLALVRSELPGLAVVPAGPCAGAALRLDVPELVMTMRANRRGGVRFPITVPDIYDRYVVVDLATCVTSALGTTY
jgi:hypothetical protein